MAYNETHIKSNKGYAVNKYLQTAKNFVVKYQTPIAVVATAAICLCINRWALNDHNNFLKEHDLYELYYNPID